MVSDIKIKRQTAQRVLTAGQAVAFAIIVSGVTFGLVVNYHKAVVGFIASAMIFWIVFVGFRIVLWVAAKSYRYPTTRLIGIDSNLPNYTILVALYRESRVLPQLVGSISNLSYPKDKLQVLLLLEEEDEETWTALSYINLPAYFEIISVPPGGPKSKPNALNFGLARANGKYLVVYDAEDIPDSDQLLKSVATFRGARPDVVCLQARLAFRNGTSSWVTRFYWAEYITHFEWMLTGMATLGIVPPLGGTSNHFITKCLYDVAIAQEKLPFKTGYIGGWDPYNMTEDAELAAVLASHGYRVLMLDSTTKEEAPARLVKADKQRRRWLKGYAQTGLVYTRQPIRTARRMGLKNWFFFNLIMLGTPISLLLNPFFWSATVVYFATRTTVIEQLFPLPLYYAGLLLMVVGNLVLFYQMVAACLKREGYGSVKYMVLVPVWWLFASWSAYAMLPELAFRPHHWHKTEHGHDLEKEELPSSKQGTAG